MFIERIKQLREECQLPLRKFAAALDVDSATYWKIEHGERRAKREHITIIAEILQADPQELPTLWLADQVTAVVADKHKIADKALNIAKKNINNNL
jgi:transcriptional regulator with XRE-family HTH domain